VTAKKVAQAPEWLTAADRLRLYTPEEVVAAGWLPHTVRSLKDLCYAKKVPHTKVGGKNMFRLDHIWAIQQVGDVDPATRGRRSRAA
jgi:hypothetical protein